MNEPAENSRAASASPDAPARPICRQCLESLDGGDNFCRYCGEMTEHGAAMVAAGKLPPRATREPVARPPSWIENPVLVLMALFLVLGPLALPMLWHSRRFTRGWKIALTLAVLLETAALVWYPIEVFRRGFEPLFQVLK